MSGKRKTDPMVAEQAEAQPTVEGYLLPSPQPAPGAGAASEERIQALCIRALRSDAAIEILRCAARDEIALTIIQLKAAMRDAEPRPARSGGGPLLSELDPIWLERFYMLAEAKGEPPSVYLLALITRAWVMDGASALAKKRGA